MINPISYELSSLLLVAVVKSAVRFMTCLHFVALL